MAAREPPGPNTTKGDPMGLFSRKIDRVSTEEDRYRAAQQAATAPAAAIPEAVYQEAKRAAVASAQARREAKAAKRARITTVGQIKKVGRGKYVTTGWEINAPDGSGRGRVTETEVTHTDTLGGFTPAELCRIAHGAGCRRCC
ncbi:hypothetical protein pZL12.75c [Streptomyces phage ZL12]|uniref:Uncharacterized protein n=1 Tax=Streptomyces phage ZL12 TaxID=2570911 RepID=D0UWI0_9CAUD|nr:hypothetical protein QEH43_gp075 [Streptomyces phage ZL12]ACX71152.1 hypothetical protein pZL12.75c [Streptomyces phage ZL12]